MSSPGETGDDAGIIAASLRQPSGIGNQDEFLFDPVTFAYLGSGKTGSVVSRGIVDAVRQRPCTREGPPRVPGRPFAGRTQPKKTSASS